VAGEMMDDDEMEPLSINGLGGLTPAQKALAEFLEVDQDLLAGAGMGSPAAVDQEISQRETDKWIDDLPRGDVKTILKQLLTGKGQQAERTLKNRFAVWRRGLRGDRLEAPRRTLGELRENAGEAEKIRLEQKKREQTRLEIKRRMERKAYLKNLSKDFPRMWKSVEQTVERGSGLAYDEACRTLVDISEAYTLHANRKRFQQELKKFMDTHMRRKALVQRLVKAGIWKDE
jgi:hypothetical protein